ncbi:hypothetical protein Tco_0352418 [Tanacetum coccineum]
MLIMVTIVQHVRPSSVNQSEPSSIKTYFNFSQNSQSFQQQYLCCDYCGGPHETFQCQPMNEDYYHEQNPCYDSNSFGFDQLQTPQFSVNHQPPQPMSMEALQAQEDLMKSIESFLKKFNRISFGKTPKVLLHAWDNFIEVKHAQPEEVQELLSKLVQDMKIISDELSEYINTPAWNRPLVYCDDDDDEDYTIAITPILSTEEPVNSLIMEDEHLDTISATESDEFIKSSVEILVPIPSESKGVPPQVFLSSNDVKIWLSIIQVPNREPVSSKVMEIVIPKLEGLRMNIPFLIKELPSLNIVECQSFLLNLDVFYHESSADETCSTLISSTGSMIVSADCPDCEDSQFLSFIRGSGYQQKDRKTSQNDKTEHGMEKTVQNQGQIIKEKNEKENMKRKRKEAGASLHLSHKELLFKPRQPTGVQSPALWRPKPFPPLPPVSAAKPPP